MYLEEIEKNNNNMNEEIEINNIKIDECSEKIAKLNETSGDMKFARTLLFSAPFWFILVLCIPKIVSLNIISVNLIQPLIIALSLSFGTIVSKIYNIKHKYNKKSDNTYDLRTKILLLLEKDNLNAKNIILSQCQKKLTYKADFYKKIMENAEFKIKPRKIILTEEEIRNINDEINKNSKKVDDLTNNITIRSLMNEYSDEFNHVSTMTMLFILAYMIPITAISKVLELPFINVIYSLTFSTITSLVLSKITFKIKSSKSMKIVGNVIEELKNEGIDIDLEKNLRDLRSERENIINNIVDSECKLLLANIDEDNSVLEETNKTKEKEYVEEYIELPVDNQSRGPKLILK